MVSNVSPTSNNPITVIDLIEPTPTLVNNVPTYSTYNVGATNVTASGSGATFSVTKFGTTYSVTLSNGGTGYSSTAGSNTIKILGSSVGGISPQNDIGINITGVTSGAIRSTGFVVTYGSSVTGRYKLIESAETVDLYKYKLSSNALEGNILLWNSTSNERIWLKTLFGSPLKTNEFTEFKPIAAENFTVYTKNSRLLPK